MAGPYRGRANFKLSYAKGFADIEADEYGRVIEIEGPPEVAQACELGLRIARPSYIYDKREGFPWFMFLGKWFPNFMGLLRLQARDVIARDERIKSLPQINVDWLSKENRQIGVEFEGFLHDDETLKSEFNVVI